MEDGRWRMKDEGRRMEDEEKNIFFMLKMHMSEFEILGSSETTFFKV